MIPSQSVSLTLCGLLLFWCPRLVCKTEEVTRHRFVYGRSADLWLQVPIMAANSKGPCGTRPHHSLLLSPRTSECVREKREKVSSEVIRRLACVCVCASMCVSARVCVCLYVSPSSGFNGDFGRVWKAQATPPHSRQAAVCERKASVKAGQAPAALWPRGGRRRQGARFHAHVFIWVTLCGFLIYKR